MDSNAIKNSSPAAPADAKTAPKEVRFEYIQDEQYRVVPITGVVGHAAPGQFGVFASFWLEHLRTPTKFIREIGVDGVGPEIPEDRGVVWLRRIYTSFVMSPDKAREIGAWLIQQADRADAARAEIAKESVDGSDGD